MKRLLSFLVIVALLCGLCASAQHKRTPPKRTQQRKPHLNLKGIVEPLPEDEVLYDEYERLLNQYDRWRLAIVSDTDAKNKSVDVYYDKQSIGRPVAGHVQEWVKHVDVDASLVLRSHSVY